MAGAKQTVHSTRRGLLAVALAVCAASWTLSQVCGFVFGAGSLARSPSPQTHSLRRIPRAATASLTVTEAKERLMSLLEEENPMREQVSRIGEAVKELERLNPTEEPVYSELLDGNWTVVYTGSYAEGLLSSPTRELALFLYGGGYSLGTALSSFANGFWGQAVRAKVTGKSVMIQGGRDVEAEATVELAGIAQKLGYKAEILAVSPWRLTEEVVGLDLPLPGPFSGLGSQEPPVSLRRNILVTYLDDEVMIVRDESGLPEVLKRQAVPAADAAMAMAATAEVNATMEAQVVSNTTSKEATVA